MAAVLELVSKNPTLRLASKAVLLALLTFLLRSQGFSFAWLPLFLLTFAFFYFKEAIGVGKFWVSASSLLFIIFALPGNPALEMSMAPLFGLLSYWLLGIKNLIFLKREVFYDLLHFSQVLILAIIASQGLWFLVLPIFYLLFQEFYSNSLVMEGKKIWLTSGVVSLLLAEVLWLSSLLPLGPLLAGALTTVVVIFLHDSLLNYFRGSLSYSIILRDMTLFIFLTLFILTSVRWSLL